MQLPSSHCQTIHLDAVDCCALWHAIKHQPKLFARWTTFKGRLQLLRGILLTSISLSFMPTDEIIDMYRSLAKAELQRLSTGALDGLGCKHPRKKHQDALGSILRRLPGTVTN